MQQNASSSSASNTNRLMDQPPNYSSYCTGPDQERIKAARFAQVNARLKAAKCLSYEKKIYYLTEYDEIEQASRELLNWVNKNIPDGVGLLPVGFDMEWPFTYRTGPLKTALIQFSFSLNVCYLFQVWKFDTLPQSLIELVRHPKLLLHGNKIKNDLRKLGRDFKEVGDTDPLVARCCDLGSYANRVLNVGENWSMERLVKEFLKTNINKDKAVRMSEWNRILSEEQQIYAAIDVIASQLVFQKIRYLEEKHKTEEEIKVLLLELEKDFEREDREKRNDLDELLVEYERIQMILNKSPPPTPSTQENL
ncbi:3'-5' exonuclease [Culicoides brevitarsis]|uniref:3'-5' exonuclease n=1 Tax=Culicoides brevitarsis TaxID=469753 RepID=UPI00307C6151